MSHTIHVWAPGLFDFKGGIQVYSDFLLSALVQNYPENFYDAFLMHDRPRHNTSSDHAICCQSTSTHAGNLRFHYAGNSSPQLRKAHFTAQVLSAGLWQRPDLVIATHLNFTLAAHRLKQLANVPYWAIAHGFEAWDIQRPALQRALAQADQVLAVSHYTRDRLLKEQSLHPEKVRVLPNTFDAQRFCIAPKPAHLLQTYNLKPDQPIILTVNRLAAGEPFHSYDPILAELPHMRQVLPSLHYLIVGTGDDRPRIERYIAQHHLQDCVTLAGFVPDAALPDYYNLCDVFAMPSKLEGFGIVYLEALASGKPVVAGLDGARDALQNGKLGVLVNPDDSGAIAHALIQVLQQSYPNPLLYQPQALRDAVIQAFGFHSFQQTLMHLIHALPSNPAAGLVPRISDL